MESGRWPEKARIVDWLATATVALIAIATLLLFAVAAVMWLD